MSKDFDLLVDLLTSLDIMDHKDDILKSYNTVFEDDKLISLDLIRSGITELYADSFQSFIHLKHLFLSHNPIHTLPVTIFHPLKQLEHLDLRGIDLLELHPDQFSTLFKLKRLELNDNKLDQIPPGIFDNLYSLVELNLSNNAINKLHPELFDNLGHLERFYLYFNPLPGDLALGDYYDREAVEEVIKRISNIFN